MLIESLNIGLPKKETFHGKTIHTGIGKRPVLGPQYLKKLGFDGDGVADLKNHDGQDKAVCVYSLDHYPFKLFFYEPPCLPPGWPQAIWFSNILKLFKK